MRRIVHIITLITLLSSCKEEAKNDINRKNKADDGINTSEQSGSTYDDQLFDLRLVNKRFNEDLFVEEFGVDKVNDSTYKLVLKLDPNTTHDAVLKYGIGVRGMNNITYNNDLLGAYAPKLEEIDNNRYIRLRAVLPNTQYFDSLNFYIYERKNWKGSGMLGSFWISDIMLVE